MKENKVTELLQCVLKIENILVQLYIEIILLSIIFSEFFCTENLDQALQNIFPNLEHAVLSAACTEANGDINKAVDIVLTKGEYFRI